MSDHKKDKNIFIERLLNLCVSVIEAEENLRKIKGEPTLEKEKVGIYSLELSRALISNMDFMNKWRLKKKEECMCIIKKEVKKMYEKAD